MYFDHYHWDLNFLVPKLPKGGKHLSHFTLPHAKCSHLLESCRWHKCMNYKSTRRAKIKQMRVVKTCRLKLCLTAQTFHVLFLCISIYIQRLVQLYVKQIESQKGYSSSKQIFEHGGIYATHLSKY